MKHPHAELMLEYAKDAMETDKPWERWEVQFWDSVWETLSLNPHWHSDRKYRRKPKPYEPTLLDQALELEIEAVNLRINHYKQSKFGYSLWCEEAHLFDLKNQRTHDMIEYLKLQGKL